MAVTTAPAYGAVPLFFERNVGQTDAAVEYLSRGSGYTLFLTREEAVLLLADLREEASEPEQAPDAGASVLRMRFTRGAGSSTPSGENALEGRVNYLLGDDPSAWLVDVPTYGSVRYGSVAPGIDLVYYGNGQKLEYDFVVAPGADPSAAEITFEGADRLDVDRDGNLVLTIAGRELRHSPPRLYQEIGGERREVAGRYELRGNGAVGFVCGPYDASRSLVVDPTLVYSTILGGVGSERGLSIDVDASGAAYVTGWSTSPDFPTFAGYDSTHAGISDAFVTKLSPSGTSFVYSTFLGGSADDTGDAIAVDASGAAYVLGGSFSADFPTVNGFQLTRPAGINHSSYVTKLAPSGAALVYSTFLGPVSGLYSGGIAVGPDGSAYVAGATDSSAFPLQNPIDSTLQRSEGFVSKISPSGGALVYSTLLGGDDFDHIRGVAVDASGAAYVAGETTSPDFPTVAAFDSTFNASEDYEGFVAKINPAGSALVFSTYLGGGANDYVHGIALGPRGEVFVAGDTQSPDFPTVSAALPSPVGSREGFVTRLSASGSTLVYSTFLGGTSDDGAAGIAVDATGAAYVTGVTRSADFPLVDAIHTTLVSADFYVTKVHPSGTSFVYSTFLGTDGYGSVSHIAVDGAGSAYVTGSAETGVFPTLPPIDQPPTAPNAFVVKIAADPEPCVPPAIVSQPVGQAVLPGQSATLSVVASGSELLRYQWYQGPSGATGAPVQGATFPVFRTPPLSTSAEFWVLVSNDCGSTSSASAALTVVPQSQSADLSVKVTSPHPTLGRGGIAPFTITVRNAGPNDSGPTTLTVTFSAQTPFQEFQGPDGWSYATPPPEGLEPVTCTTAGMAPGSEAVFTLVVRVPGELGLGVDLDYAATIAGTAADPRNDDNADRLTVETGDYGTIPFIRSAEGAGGSGGKPWRLKLNGHNFVEGSVVYIGDDTSPWPKKKLRAYYLLILKGRELRERFPVGVPVRIRVVNPGGASSAIEFTR